MHQFALVESARPGLCWKNADVCVPQDPTEIEENVEHNASNLHCGLKLRYYHLVIACLTILCADGDDTTAADDGYVMEIEVEIVASEDENEGIIKTSQECGICMVECESKDLLVLRRCRHTFCRDCIAEYVKVEIL